MAGSCRTRSSQSSVFGNRGLLESAFSANGYTYGYRYVSLCRVQGQMGLTNSLSIAQAFIQNTAEAWRWPYYLNAIFTFVSLAGLFIAYHPPTYRQLHNHPTEDPPVKDWLGLFVLAGTAALLSFSLQWGLLIYSRLPLYYHVVSGDNHNGGLTSRQTTHRLSVFW